MKSSALVNAALVSATVLVCGSALAAQNASVWDQETDAGPDRAAAVSAGSPSNSPRGIIVKTKSGLSRVGDKTRATDRISQKISKTNVRWVRPRGDTRTMGGSAPESGRGSQDRQARMDEAYDNWKSRQR
jgi:hypothetical protein